MQALRPRILDELYARIGPEVAEKTLADVYERVGFVRPPHTHLGG